MVSWPDRRLSKLEARSQPDRLVRPFADSGAGFGLIADIAIGVVGALIGSWLLPHLGIHLGSGIVPAIIGATIGAIVLLLILRLAYRRGRW